MKMMQKKMYMIPETETLSLESMHSLMGSPDLLSPTPGEPDPGEFDAPGRRVF